MHHTFSGMHGTGQHAGQLRRMTLTAGKRRFVQLAGAYDQSTVSLLDRIGLSLTLMACLARQSLTRMTWIN